MKQRLCRCEERTIILYFPSMSNVQLHLVKQGLSTCRGCWENSHFDNEPSSPSPAFIAECDTTRYEIPFGQLRSSAPVMSPPHPLPISSLLIPIRSALWFSYCVMFVRDLFPLRVLNCVNHHLIGAS